MDRYKTVAEQFKGFFTKPFDGSYGTPQADEARLDFDQLTEYALLWTQAHGDFKDPAKRVLFRPYPHWSELHQACADVIREYVALDMQYLGGVTCARIMRDVMKVLRVRHGFDTPKWWLPLMDQLRGGVPADKQPAVTVELKDDAVVYRRPSPTSQHRVFRDGSPYPAEWDKLDGSAKRLLIAKHRAAASGK